MLVRVLVFAGVIAIVAAEVPSFLEKGIPATDPQTSVLSVAMPQQQPMDVDPHGNVRLKANTQGHYTADFKINGKPVQGLIDTGATYVAVNESTARHLGFGAANLDFRNSVNTANGETKAAFVRLDRIEIGPIRVRDVDALVLRDSALSSTLIGVSFLKRLASYSVEDGALRLTE
ncbi:TIGR02281 family clan AA aspartic protease [Rhizobium tubonense]|uniref:TIGR02281 family clan AA aspartic protease n=1 Tax=Rhizobium tubonense TaxID=484088 RepID=A0A2W4F1F7_9HYPH|nr:TIGR02281 family clan AA aspartic protease [Rhizobium tubonense]PZM16103.1 TIGR02281 family clan AA aspartic protease [Rhizobium tubonense]